MNRLYYLFRQLPGGLCLSDCLVMFPAIKKYVSVLIKENPLKGSYLYQEKNIRPKEDYMQLNIPINTCA